MAVRWTADEVEELLELIKGDGRRWAHILSMAQTISDHRTQVDLKVCPELKLQLDLKVQPSRHTCAWFKLGCSRT